jgi:hypothetical protein
VKFRHKKCPIYCICESCTEECDQTPKPISVIGAHHAIEINSIDAAGLFSSYRAVRNNVQPPETTFFQEEDDVMMDDEEDEEETADNTAFYESIERSLSLPTMTEKQIKLLRAARFLLAVGITESSYRVDFKRSGWHDSDSQEKSSRDPHIKLLESKRLLID